jgi:hypothetical protein
MPPATGASSGKEMMNHLDDVVQRLDWLEELVCAVTRDLFEAKAQQSALGVSLIRLEQQVPGPGNGALVFHTPNPVDGPALPTGNYFIAPPPPGANANLTTLGLEGRTMTQSTVVTWPTHHTRSNSQSLMTPGIQCRGSIAVSGISCSAALRSTDASRCLLSIFSMTPKYGTTASSSTAGRRRGIASSSSSTRTSDHPSPRARYWHCSAGTAPLTSIATSSWPCPAMIRPYPRSTKCSSSLRGLATNFGPMLPSRSHSHWTRRSCTRGLTPGVTHRVPCRHQLPPDLALAFTANHQPRPPLKLRAQDRRRRWPPSTARRSS